MPKITDQPPAAIGQELAALSQALDDEIPAKQDGQNLLIATWNIRSFSSLTRKWTAAQTDSPKRDLRGLRAIIEILSRFDVIAIQEAQGDLRALRDTLHFLGDDWGLLMTDVTRGDAGHSERLAYLFDRRRLKPSGLAAEIVVPPEWIDGDPDAAMRRQFVRTPYAVSFRAGEDTFILVTLHVIFGEPEDRVPELQGIARWMADWAKRSNRWHHNLLVLGDFNVDRKGSELWEAFTDTGLSVPEELDAVPRTIFADVTDPTGDKFYDQIAWFTKGQKKLIEMTYHTGGFFDFKPLVYQGLGLTNNSLSFRLSDHYPLWVEFHL